MFAALEGSVLGLHAPVAEALDPNGVAGVVDILDGPVLPVVCVVDIPDVSVLSRVVAILDE